MKAVALVGGFGTRLRPLTLTTPKQMLAVVDRPMLEHVIGGLGRHGVDEVVLSLGYKEDVFRHAYPDGVCAGVALRYAVEPEPLDTAGAVRFAADAAGIDETFIVVNGDVITDLDVGMLWRRHREVGAEATIHLTPVEDPSRYGVVPTDDDGRALGLVETPPPGEAPTNWINTGTYVLEPSVLERIDRGRRVSSDRETFPALVADRGLWAVQSDGYWVDSGTPATYLQVQLDLIDGTRGEPMQAVSAGAKVDASAVIERSVVMEGASVAANCSLTGSVVSDGASIGEGAIVDQSIVGPGAVVGPGARITGLSMIGDGVSIVAGALLDGARVPEEV